MDYISALYISLDFFLSLLFFLSLGWFIERAGEGDERRTRGGGGGGALCYRQSCLFTVGICCISRAPYHGVADSSDPFFLINA